MQSLYTERARSIAVAVDGSAPGWEAMGRALNLARLLNLPLEVLHIVSLRKAGYFAFIDRHLKEEWEAKAREIFQEAERRAAKAGVEVHTHLLETEKGPSEGIVDFLEKSRGVKLLAIGTYGHGFQNRAILGSTTERVIREVARRSIPVPILVVPAVRAMEGEDVI